MIRTNNVNGPDLVVTAIAAGYYHSLALKSNGTVVAWGRNNYGQSAVPADLSDVIAISGGSEHGLALRSDGTVVAWGRNSYEQSAVPAGFSSGTVVVGTSVSGGFVPARDSM